MGCKFCFHQEKFAYFWRSVSKRPKIFRAFDATNFFFAATTTFFDLKCYFLFLWPTNCSNLMCMNWHKFWCILGSARAKSLGGAYMPPLAWNKLYLRPRGIGLNVYLFCQSIHHWNTSLPNFHIDKEIKTGVMSRIIVLIELLSNANIPIKNGLKK